MPDKRLDSLNDWLENFFGDENFVISKASDDASFRRYFRIERSNSTFIAMDAPPKQENSSQFLLIAKLLNNNNIHAPKIIQADLTDGFLLLEDLGSSTFLDTLKGKFNTNLYKLAIDILIEIQSIDTQNINLPSYNSEILNTEMQLLIDWYLPKELSSKQSNNLKKIFKILIDNSLNSGQVLVHRDYHCRNLMFINDNDLGVIDFQDAVIGSNTYDLCSLLKDAYFELNQEQLQTLLKYFYNKSNISTKFTDFIKQFELMGLQRHLKILGIFKRLSIRDGKHQYLEDIPLVKKYALQIANKYPEFSILKEIL